MRPLIWTQQNVCLCPWITYIIHQNRPALFKWILGLKHWNHPVGAGAGPQPVLSHSSPVPRGVLGFGRPYYTITQQLYHGNFLCARGCSGTNHPWAAAPSDAHLLMHLHLGLGKAFPVAVAPSIFSLGASGETLSLAACWAYTACIYKPTGAQYHRACQCWSCGSSVEPGAFRAHVLSSR